MVICVKIYKIAQTGKYCGLCEPPGILVAKFPHTIENFDVTNPDLWKRYIRRYYPKVIKKYGDKIRWFVMRFGGVPPIIVYFPGYDKEGKMLDLYAWGKV